MKNVYLWIGALVIVVLIAGYYILAQTQKKASPTTTPSQSTQITPVVTESADMVEKNFVESQDQPASSTVTTKLVRSEGFGFIAIHVDVNGQPGKVIGNSELFPSGENRNIVAKVSPATKTGDVVYAMYHTDANGNGKYEFPGDDAPVKDSQGNTVMAKITIL